MPADKETHLTTLPAVDGLLLVDKPAGVSSHDVVSVARRVLGEKRIGHAGTLDPFATGLLVLLVGRATRLLQHLPHEPKRYDAVVRFGTETDSEDLTGTVTREAALPDVPALETARQALIGDIAQVPPAYSAKRVDGTRAYKLARKGEVPDLKPVEVHVDDIVLDGFEMEGDRVVRCRMHVVCGGGTYVRSLARDLARAAGTAAHLEALRRTDSGPFSVRNAVTLDALKEGAPVLGTALDALPGYPRQSLAPDDVARVVRGIDVAARVAGTHAALITASAAGDTLVCFAERRTSEVGDRWQPRVVMRGDD
jgi:tRNA pseudouridine55 synthase